MPSQHDDKKVIKHYISCILIVILDLKSFNWDPDVIMCELNPNCRNQNLKSVQVESTGSLSVPVAQLSRYTVRIVGVPMSGPGHWSPGFSLCMEFSVRRSVVRTQERRRVEASRVVMMRASSLDASSLDTELNSLLLSPLHAALKFFHVRKALMDNFWLIKANIYLQLRPWTYCITATCSMESGNMG